MNPAHRAQARALAAHPMWVWRAGVLARGSGGRGWGSPWLPDRAERVSGGGPPYLDHAHPDLDDAATAGVLLGMLPRGMMVLDHGAEDGWEIREGTRTLADGSTLGVAVARALLAVWEGT